MGQLELEGTIMAIREEIMNYFKGTCIDRVVSDSGVQLMNRNLPRGRFQYEREENDRRRPCLISLNGLTLFELDSSPEILTFKSTLGRSPQLEEVKKAIEKFMGKYLKAIEVKHYKGKKVAQVDDSGLLSAKLRDREQRSAIDEYLLQMQRAQSRPNRHYVWNAEILNGFRDMNIPTADMTPQGVNTVTVYGAGSPITLSSRGVFETAEPDLTDVPF